MNKQSSDIRREKAIARTIQHLREDWTKPGVYAKITITVQNGIITNDAQVVMNVKLGEG